MNLGEVLDALRQPVVCLDRAGAVMHANTAFVAVFGSANPEILKTFPAHPIRNHRFEWDNRVLVCESRDIEGGILLSFEDRTGAEGLTNLLRFQRRLQGALAHAIYFVDPEFRFQSFNRAAEKLFGFSAAEVIGKRAQDVVQFEGDSPRESARESLLAGKAITTEGRVRRKDGSTVEVYFAVSPVFEEDGTLIGYSGVMHDIGPTKRLERSLRENARALAEANKELESFSSSVSHDLRSPLRAIDGFTRIILDEYGEKMPEDEARLFANIRRNTKRMGKLIDDLLEFSRIGRRSIARETVDMNAIVAAAVEECRPSDRVVEFRVGPLPDAIGDRALLKQVWLNLIRNSVKYTARAEKPLVSIRGEMRPGETFYAVQDNGAGFDMQYVGQLFGVFNRLHSDFEGTGVGLALVRRIVHRHGGEVAAQGKVDAGATFTFTLPARTSVLMRAVDPSSS